MTQLSRIGVSVLVLSVCLIVGAFTWGMFPRTAVGVVLLLVIGFPLTLVGEFFAEVALSDAKRPGYLRLLAAFSLLCLLAALWWLLGTHSNFIHRNFVE